MRAKIHEQTNTKSCCLQIVQNLGFVLGSDFPDCLDFKNYSIEADKVGPESLQKGISPVRKSEFFLRLIRDFYPVKLPLQALLVNRLQKPSTHFPIDFKNRPLNLETLLSEKDLLLARPLLRSRYGVPFVCFVVLQSVDGSGEKLTTKFTKGHELRRMK